MRSLVLILGLVFHSALPASDIDARQLVRQAMDHWRGLTSYSEMTMTIHRPDWERTMTMRSWNEGDKLSLVRVVEPKKDAGNGTLLNDNNMWTYTPKINRIIKVPSSMMAQSWMGSDFSNKDIAKSTDIIDQYDHELTGKIEVDGQTHYTITSVPHEDAAVVWGKEVLTVRDDFVLMEQQFWDQDGVLVKSMKTLEIEEMGGRAVAKIMRMGKLDTPDEWTEIRANAIEFDIDMPANTFTLSNLKKSAPMNLSLRMAWRNLWRHKRRTWLTTTAMIFSNVLLVFMISLQFGSYDMMINNTLQAFSGHIQVQHEAYNDNPKIRSSIAGIVPLAEKLRRSIPDVSIAARGSAFALASSEQRSLGIQIIGVEPAFEPAVSTFPGLISQGSFLQDSDAAEIVIGTVLARNLKVTVGDELTLLGSGRDGSFAAGVVTIKGIFDSGSGDIDRSLAEVPLAYFQDTFAMQDHGHAIVVAVDGLENAGVAQTAVESQVEGIDSLNVLGWNLLHPGLKQAIQADLSSAWFMYGVLIILVAFSVMNTQLMSVLERTREFGVITALGIKPRKLASLVMLETALMALLGLLIGLLLGWMLALYFNSVGFSYPGMEEMGAKFNLPSQMYPSVTFFSMLLGPSVVFLFCLLAAVYPSLRLFQLQPVQAMRAV